MMTHSGVIKMRIPIREGALGTLPLPDPKFHRAILVVPKRRSAPEPGGCTPPPRSEPSSDRPAPPEWHLESL